MPDERLQCEKCHFRWTPDRTARICPNSSCSRPVRLSECSGLFCEICGTPAKSGERACKCPEAAHLTPGYQCPHCKRVLSQDVLQSPQCCPACGVVVPLLGPSRSPTDLIRRRPFRTPLAVGLGALLVLLVWFAANHWQRPKEASTHPSTSTTAPQPGQAPPPPGANTSTEGARSRKSRSPSRTAKPKSVFVPAPARDHPSNSATNDRQKSTAANPPPTVPPPGPSVHDSQPVINSFTADPNPVENGKRTTLHWQVTGDNMSVEIEPDIGPVSAAGSISVQSEISSPQFTLFAKNSAGTQSRILHIDVQESRPPAIAFSADSLRLRLGESTALRWSVTGASTLRLDPGFGPVNLSDAVTVRPVANTKYTLYASGPGGATSSTVTIAVSGHIGPASGQLVWTGVVSQTQIVMIDHDHANLGTLQGALPGLPCVIQPVRESRVTILHVPSPSDNYRLLTLRIIGHGSMRVLIQWSLIEQALPE